ncbi:MAG: rhomboid family intramembrane serine protease [Acidimicrobiales bacterium]|nr:rhomboid family intramembrane serine protease [Acidimicrobiales bacterium]
MSNAPDLEGSLPDSCHRHPDNRAGVRCQRCERLICALCMHTASVGFHCSECVARPAQRSGVQRASKRSNRRQVKSVVVGPIEGPPATLALVALNLLAFLVMVFLGGGARGGGVYDRFASGGGTFTVDYGLLGIGRSGPRLIGVAEGEWGRLLTGGFLHAGLLHVLINMFLLWMLGRQLEMVHGPVRYAGLYMASLLAGSFGVMLHDPQALTVGASGAVFGLMAAAIVHQLRQGVSPWGTGLGGLLLVNVIFTFGRPGISIGGHLGGLVGGALVGWLVDGIDRRGASRAVATAVPWLAAVAFTVGAVWAASRWWDPVLG